METTASKVEAQVILGALEAPEDGKFQSMQM